MLELNIKICSGDWILHSQSKPTQASVIPVFLIPKKLLFDMAGCRSVALYRSFVKSAISNLALTWAQSEIEEANDSPS